MVSENILTLESVLTLEEPLGPSHQDAIGDKAAESLLDGKVTPFANVGSNPYMLLLGRSGSGKSAILTEIRLKLRSGRRRMQISEGLPEEGEPYIISVNSWEHFFKITRNVSRQRFQLDELLTDLIPTEYYRALWKEVLWDEIIQHFFNYSHFSEAQDTLAPVNDYINVDARFQDSAEEEAKRLSDAARNSILDFLEQRNSRLYILLDSMENYPVRNNIFSGVLTGFFTALSSINAEPRIQVSFCVPEELEGFFASSSANLLKDFASSYRIRWRPIELLRIAAHRFRLAMKVHDPGFYDDIRDLDFSRRDHIHRLFGRMLPNPMHNSLGDSEDPFAYILRHTQLLPGHVIAIFNAILSRNYVSTGGFRRVEERAIQEGIAYVQYFVARQILSSYGRLYPNLIAACREILPDLNPISCSFDDLKEAEGRFKQRIEEDVFSVWDTLFQMGVIGRVGEPGGDGSPPARQFDRYRYTHFHYDRYRYAHFHFNIDGAFVVATNSEYCFHPVFSKYFGMVRPDGDKRVICPANIDMVMLP